MSRAIRAQAELEQMYAWTRPQVLVPVHGEAMHLVAQARLGAAAGIRRSRRSRNGDMLRLAPGPAEIIDASRSGASTRTARSSATRTRWACGDRRKLSFAGLVACSIVIDRNGRMADEIDIALHGLPEMTPSGDAFDDVIFDAVSGAVESIPPAKRKDEELVMRAAEKSISAAARDHWGKKPVVTVFVAKV